VMIWKFSIEKGIQLIYFWQNSGISKIFKTPNYFFPPPSYLYILENLINQSFPFVQHDDDSEKFFFEEMIDKHIEDECFFMLYGEELIKASIYKKNIVLQKLCNKCISFIFENNETIFPNIYLLRIISQSAPEIAEKNPIFFADFIMKISFFCIFDQFFLENSLEIRVPFSHLQHYGNY
ncbi:25520_t:CDS:1, partial [Gigaspora rosea]